MPNPDQRETSRWVRLNAVDETTLINKHRRLSIVSSGFPSESIIFLTRLLESQHPYKIRQSKNRRRCDVSRNSCRARNDIKKARNDIKKARNDIRMSADDTKKAPPVDFEALVAGRVESTASDIRYYPKTGYGKNMAFI